RRRKIENLALMLCGAIAAQGRVGLMLNVEKRDLTNVLAVLPALKRPTISQLSDDGWVAVNTVIEERAAATVARLADRGAAATASVEPAVRRIVAAVRRGGDRALVAYARKFDGLAANQALRVSSDELQAAWRECPADLRAALRAAARNIRRFAQWQRPAEWRREIAPGVCVGQLVRPLESVGCYVPGGRYPLPSTLLMTVVPAQV